MQILPPLNRPSQPAAPASGRRRPFLAPLLVPALAPLLIAGLACGGPRTPDAGAKGIGEGVQQREISPVRTARVEKREMVRILETTSKLESEFEIEVFARSSGLTLEVLVEEGDRVERDAPLARLDDRDERLAVRDAEVALSEAQSNHELLKLAVEDARQRKATAERNARQAERDYERDRDLAENFEVASPVSEQALETSLLARDTARAEEAQAEIALRRTQQEVRAAENAIARAEVSLERAELNLEYKEIRAPFGGVIAQRSCRPGDMVQGASAAFVLTDIDNLRAVFTRPQEELELFKGIEPVHMNGHGNGGDAGTGHLSITATAEAFPGRTFEGWVERISPTIDAESGQFRVTARIASIEGADPARLLPGMLVRMRIVTDRHPDALVVPKRAMRREGARRYILAVTLVEGNEDGDSEEPASKPAHAPLDPRDPSDDVSPVVSASYTEEEPGEDGTETSDAEDEADEKLYTVHRIDVTEGYADDEFVEVLPRTAGSIQAGMEIVLVGSRDLTEGDTVRLDEGDDLFGADGADGADGAGDKKADEDEASSGSGSDE